MCIPEGHCTAPTLVTMSLLLALKQRDVLRYRRGASTMLVLLDLRVRFNPITHIQTYRRGH